MLNEPISDDENVGLSKKQLLKLKKASKQSKQPNKMSFNMLNEPISDDENIGLSKKQLVQVKKINNHSHPSQSNNKTISPLKDLKDLKEINNSESDDSGSSYDPFEEAKKRARAKILSTTKITPIPISDFNPESNPDFNLSPRELFKKAITFDDDDQNKLAIKYYILCIKKYLEDNKIITMKFIRTARNAFGNLAILLDIEEIKTDFIEIGYKFGICGGNYNLLHCYAEYSRNKAYLLEYLLVSKLEPTSEDFILWKELTEESLFKELSLFNYDILNEKLKLINY